MTKKRMWSALALLAVLALVPVPAVAATEAAPAVAATTAADAESIAIDFVQAEAASYGVSAADVADLGVSSVLVSDHTGVTHVNLAQRFQGLNVFGAAATVNLNPDSSILFVGESLVGNLRVASDTENLDAAAAVAAAADGLGLAEPVGLRVLEEADNEAVLTEAGISDEPIEASLGWFSTAQGLRLAWQVTIDDSSDVHLWNATVDAGSGALLDREDWTSSHNASDLAHLRRPVAAPTLAALLAPGGSSNPVNDGSSYRVYGYPLESPNDGPRIVVSNPADALASPFGWHDTDGAAGPEYTITRGNNVNAFLEQDNDQQPDYGGQPEGGAGLDFDFPADLTQHSQAYRDAVATNLFYMNNVIHDVLYVLGFTEAFDNFQANNYGRAPTPEGDYVRAHVASGAGTNNANFSTPSSGGSPRMRMYLWPGNQFGSQNQVVVNGLGDFGGGWARFGPPASVSGASGQFFDAGNGCVPADYAGAPGGNWIAIVVGGNTGCQAIEKARQADAAGAVAVVMTTGTSSTGIVSAGSGNMLAPGPDIPSVVVSSANGDAIRAALPASGTVRKHPDHPGIRDGDFENGIIIHEYGHGISNRLTGGLGVNCLSGNEQMGEGWSDYYATTMLLDPALDNPQLARGMGPYALFQPDRHGAGIRLRPYSRDMNIQPFTYDMIKTNGWINGTTMAAPHQIGMSWASTMWDMTWNLIDAHGFNPDIYDDWSTGGNILSLQLVTDGLKLQGCGPGFVVGRAAIIAADQALTGGENYCLLWRTFARRGLGVSAIQGTTNRDDNTQAFDVPAECTRQHVRVNLSGTNVPSAWQVPNAGDLDATGGVQVSWGQNGRVCLSRFQLTGLSASEITSVTIHSGGHGEPGGAEVINFNIPPNGLNSCVNGVSTALLQDIQTQPSRYYIQATTADFPGGAIRGQIDDGRSQP